MQKYYKILIFTVFLASCDSLEESTIIDEPTESDAEISGPIVSERTPVETIEPFEIDGKFDIDNFSVDTFQSYLSTEGANILVDFTLSPELHNLVEQQDEILYELRFSNPLLEMTETYYTDRVEAELSDDDDLTGSISFNVEWENALTKTQLNRLSDDELRYSLIIYDETGHPVQEYVDVHLLPDVNENSSHLIID